MRTFRSLSLDAMEVEAQGPGITGNGDREVSTEEDDAD